jgi:CheY-like chemotaxis protein
VVQQLSDLELKIMKNKILIVDDDVSSVEMLQILFEEEGFEVVSAYRGRQALNIMSHEKVDLVLLDYQMPEMDGFEVLDYMNNNGFEKNIPVIMVSANYDKDVYDSAFRKGVKYFIHKPLSWNVLMKQVVNLL